MESFENAAKWRIGLSATPEIENNENATRRIFSFFNNICTTYTLAQGIDDGVLCKYNYYPQPVYLDPRKGARYAELLSLSKSHNPSERINAQRESNELIRKSEDQIQKLDEILSDLKR